MANENPAENPREDALKGQILTLRPSEELDQSMLSWIQEIGVREVWQQIDMDDQIKGKHASHKVWPLPEDTSKEVDPAPAELTPENREWAERKIDEGYEASQSAIEHHFLREGDRPMPSLEDFKTDVLTKLTNAQAEHLQALEKANQVIEFFVTPLASGARFQEVLNKPALKPFRWPKPKTPVRAKQQDPFMSQHYADAIDACRPAKSTKDETIQDYTWSLGVCSLSPTTSREAPDASYNSHIMIPRKDRIQAFEKYHAENDTGLSSMDAAEYAMLQILKALKHGLCDSLYESKDVETLTGPWPSGGHLVSYTVLPAKDEEGITGKASAHNGEDYVCAGEFNTAAHQVLLITKGTNSEMPSDSEDWRTRLRPRVMHILGASPEQA